MFDLVNDPAEQNNLLFSEASRNKPEIAAKFAELKAEIARLQEQYKDEGQFADPATWPKGGSDGPFDDKKPVGKKSIAEAMQLTAASEE